MTMRDKWQNMLVVALALSLSATAQAADLRMPAVRVGPAIEVGHWTGFYIGAHVGAGWGTNDWDFNDLTIGAPYLWNNARAVNGAIGGGQIGYNYQAGALVLGIEADGSWSGIKGSGACGTTALYVNCATKPQFLTTLTGRLGGAVDRALIYAKAGAAWAHDQDTLSSVDLPPSATAFTTQLTNNRFGWTLGMGLEYALAPSWSAKLEWDYMEFSARTTDFAVTNTVVDPSNFANWSIAQRLHTMKVGVNYRFN